MSSSSKGGSLWEVAAEARVCQVRCRPLCGGEREAGLARQGKEPESQLAAGDIEDAQNESSARSGKSRSSRRQSRQAKRGRRSRGTPKGAYEGVLAATEGRVRVVRERTT